MTPDRFLQQHARGLAAQFGIQLRALGRGRARAEMDVGANHAGADGSLHGALVQLLADSASGYARALAQPSQAAQVVDTRTQRFNHGQGLRASADCAALDVASGHSVWRSQIRRGDALVAEVTHTYVHELDVPLAPSPPGDAKAVVVAEKDFANGGVVDERRRQIFEAACRVISRKGFAKATIREIAAAAKMPVPTMYQYLEHKEDLLYQLYESFMRDTVTELEQWRRNDSSARARLLGAMSTLIDGFDRNHRYVKTMFQETRALSEDARAKVYQLDAGYIDVLTRLLEDVANEERCDPGEAELTANFIYFLCVVWPLRYWCIGKFGRDQVAHHIARFVMRGLGLSEPTEPAHAEGAIASSPHQELP